MFNLVIIIRATTENQISILHFYQDVGQAILESYSRVLESLAFNVVAWIEDVLFVHASVRKRSRASQQQSQ